MLAPDHTLIQEALTEHLNLHHQLKLKLHALTTLNLQGQHDLSQSILHSVKHDVLNAGLKLLPEFSLLTPRSYMEYTVQLERSLKQLRPIMQHVVAHQAGVPSEEQKQHLIHEILRLKKASEQQHLRHIELRKQLNQLLTPLRQHFMDLSTLLEDRLSAEGEEQHTIEHLQSQLQLLVQKLGRDAAEATPSSITFGTPVHGLTLRLRFQQYQEEAPVGQLGVTVSCLGVALGSQLLTPELQRDLDLLNSGMQHLHLEQQLLVVAHGARDFVKGLLKTVRRADEHQAAQAYLWTINSKLLDALLDTLTQPQIRVQTIKLLHSLLSASPAWQKVSEFALQSQSTTTHLTEVITLPPVMLAASTSMQGA
ncbi:hypothetical protein [Deinococcus cellulosilyticus]|uniref:Uncharacterized protein n=1 Tax=Deinococcus cellulosilyticus (strain DSM 18568 / NBRC 106333 / KACC 11606 / 5516J-15) TaxID=1223518 RepID=A0A511N7I8_DEIC1|nr:hypothetical protein [Deinococcus cellulosilyticus]GEM48467.1 hypothetical protein DC3_41020 [Deinococcus cellulosilyticus NBRC 106333 = KACC 11606]